MKIPENIPVFGDTEYRGKCPKESIEQITFVNELRRSYPHTYGRLLVHVKNESKRSGKQFWELERDKAMGFSPGCPDIIIPSDICLLMELKRKDHTQSRLEEDQINYLLAAQSNGAFSCVALGYTGAMQAFNAWIKTKEIPYCQK